jgi:hypothetical protein
MARALLHVVTIAALALSWALGGYGALPARLRRDDDVWLVAATALALGAGATAVALTALGVLHLLGRVAVAAVATGVALAAIAGGRRAAREGRLRFPPLPSDRARRLALLALAAVLALTLLAVLAPPASMDATIYHLRAPREFLRTGTLTALEDDSHSFQPLYVEMLFAEGLVLGGGVVAALAHWILGLGAIMAAGAWARRFGAPGIWGAVAFGATGLYVWESTSAFIDLGLALFSSLALYWATREERGRAPALLAGLFAGLAAGSKFTGLMTLAFTCLAALAAAAPDWKAGLRRGCAIGAVALVVALPWYARNLLATGNPIYPLANTLFGGPPVVFSSQHYGLGADLLHLLTSPFDLLARGGAFDQGWALGPAYLALVPLGIVATTGRRLALLVGSVLGGWWLIWFFSSPQCRLVLPMLPAAAGLAGAGMTAALASHARAPRVAAIAVLGVAIAGGVATAGLGAALDLKVTLGLETPDQFLERNSWNYVAFENANRLLPPQARVAVTGADNLYYLDRVARQVDVGDSSAALAARGFTHRLTIDDCHGRQAATPARLIIWQGRYPLRASRLRGGVLSEACARLTPIDPRLPS